MAATFVLMQIAFLTIIIKDKYETEAFSAIALILLIAITLIVGYLYLDLHHEEYSYENILVVMWVPIGAVICYLMSVYGGLGSVFSAGITGTLASFIPNINKESDYLKQLPASIYCGVFIGMSSVEISPSIGFVIAAGIIASVILMLSKNLFLGIGGKLGSIAFVGVAIVYLINTLSQ